MIAAAAVMSSNGETSVVLRGVTHGAVDFLIKPVRIEELRNVWQHVVRRKHSTEVRSRLSIPRIFTPDKKLVCFYVSMSELVASSTCLTEVGAESAASTKQGSIHMQKDPKPLNPVSPSRPTNVLSVSQEHCAVRISRNLSLAASVCWIAPRVAQRDCEAHTYVRFTAALVSRLASEPQTEWAC